jgi:hypothetical protein
MNTTHTVLITGPKALHSGTIPRAHGRCCPFCHSNEIHASTRTGLYEQVVLRLKMMEPLLCYDCGRRFYDSILD